MLALQKLLELGPTGHFFFKIVVLKDSDYLQLNCPVFSNFSVIVGVSISKTTEKLFKSTAGPIHDVNSYTSSEREAYNAVNAMAIRTIFVIN